MTTILRNILGAGAALALLGAGPAGAQVQAVAGGAYQADDRTAERLKRIENALNDLQGVVYSVEGAGGQARTVPVAMASGQLSQAQATSGDSQAAFSVRLTAIEAALADLTGRVEELSYKLDRQTRAAAMPAATPVLGPDGMPIATDPIGGVLTTPGVLETAPMESVETIANEGPTDLVGGEMPAAPMLTVDLPDDPIAAYNIGYDALLSAKYDSAEAAFEAFIEKFPNAEQTPDAKFLLGEVYLATGANSEAARVFLDHVSSYADDPRSPEAYLKLGTSFYRLDRSAEACRVFRAGEKKFPNVGSQLAAKYRDAKSQAGCS